LTDSIFVPCSPIVVPLPEAAEPLIRSQIGTIDRVLARSGVWTKFESGTSTPVTFSSLSTSTARSLKRSSQITSLATSRSAWVASRAPAAAASFEPGCAGMPRPSRKPDDPEVERLDRRFVGCMERAGRIESFGSRLPDLLLAHGPLSCFWRSAA
jgi:hypothetical protein